MAAGVAWKSLALSESGIQHARAVGSHAVAWLFHEAFPFSSEGRSTEETVQF